MVRPYENYVDYLNNTICIPSVQPYIAIDMFAGCGGLSLGFEAAGIKTIGYEMVADCCETYRKNLNSECHQAKITIETEFPKVDLIIGGPPCQPFSRRGKQTGKNDERNGFPAFIEAVRKVQPAIWVCENVKGLPEQNKEYFQNIIEEFIALGYIVEYRVFQLVKYDVPQNRERLVIVGHRGGFQFPEPNEYKVTAGEALGHLTTEIPENAAFLTPAMDEYIAKYEAASKCKNPRDLHLDRPARTLTCRNLAGATSDMHRIKLPDGRRRRITVREAARLQSFPDWFEFSGTEESQFTQIGNAVPPMFAFKLATKIKEYLDNIKGQEVDV
ncbi:MAG: DNA cytosine methyltransferase [Clostridia bacterium]|nr:DNA cytosine methyltransferase [Clostridia bacterium]